MLLKRLNVDADLSEASYKWAEEQTLKPITTLVVGSNSLNIGAKLADKYKVKLYLDTTLEGDAWYLHGQWDGVFSPGA
jgi:hypothetical protein